MQIDASIILQGALRGVSRGYAPPTAPFSLSPIRARLNRAAQKKALLLQNLSSCIFVRHFCLPRLGVPLHNPSRKLHTTKLPVHHLVSLLGRTLWLPVIAIIIPPFALVNQEDMRKKRSSCPPSLAFIGCFRLCQGLPYGVSLRLPLDNAALTRIPIHYRQHAAVYKV